MTPYALSSWVLVGALALLTIAIVLGVASLAGDTFAQIAAVLP